MANISGVVCDGFDCLLTPPPLDMAFCSVVGERESCADSSFSGTYAVTDGDLRGPVRYCYLRGNEGILRGFWVCRDLRGHEGILRGFFFFRYLRGNEGILRGFSLLQLPTRQRKNPKWILRESLPTW